MSAANSRHVGTLGIACPECLTAIEVPVTAHIKESDDRDGFVLECTPDTAHLWAHMWTHTEGVEP